MYDICGVDVNYCKIIAQNTVLTHYYITFEVIITNQKLLKL